MHASDGCARVFVSIGSNRARVQHYEARLVTTLHRREAALHQLALDRSAVGLRGSATEIFDKKSIHPKLAAALTTVQSPDSDKNRMAIRAIRRISVHHRKTIDYYSD